MELPIKAKVQCADGPGGEATHVIVHPTTKKVTRLVVRETKTPHIERVIPFRFVEEATAGQIRLRCSRQEMSRMRSFVRTELVTTWSYNGRIPTETRKAKSLNITEDELAMDAGTRIKATDGKAGRLDELKVDPSSGSITHLLLQKGPAWAPKVVMVPITEVQQMGEKAVYLRINRAGVKALPSVPAPGR